MASIKYLIKGKTELSTIYVRLRDGRNTDLVCSTGYTINPKFWSDLKGEPKQNASNPEKLNLGQKLDELKLTISSALNNDKGTAIHINKEWLEKTIQIFKNPALANDVQKLVNSIEQYQSEMKHKINPKTGKKVSEMTIKNFNTTISRLTKFEAFKKNQYLVHEVDLTFLKEYKDFATNKLLLAVNSIAKDIKQIKTVCLNAGDNGFSINKQVQSRKFNAPTEPTSFVTITENEIDLIKNFKGSDYLENARDWLIIGCWTGCRVNDLMQLTNNNILITPQGQKFIRYTQSKTAKQVDIPIHEDVQEILNRLGNFPRPISDQRFNEWIKKVCKEAGLTDEVNGTRQNPQTHRKETGTFEKWELVRSHTCRRSFATNHYNKLSNKLIMAVTGHGTEKMLLNYIGETENDHLSDFLSVWNNEKIEKEQVVKLTDKAV